MSVERASEELAEVGGGAERLLVRALHQYEKLLNFKSFSKSRRQVSSPDKEESVSGERCWRAPLLDPLLGRSLHARGPSAATASAADGARPTDFLKLLAINALEASSGASSGASPGVGRGADAAAAWFQLAGHPGSLSPAGEGVVWKRTREPWERAAYEELSACPYMRAAAPRYLGERRRAGERYLALQDLLHGFRDPHVMDVKLGTRTFLEEEAANERARADLYDKMVALEPTAPTAAERAARAVTKLRYMQFRERHSSSAELGFRIEAHKPAGAPPLAELKRVRTSEQVRAALARFLGPRPRVRAALAARLRRVRHLAERSRFLRDHELVGASLLLVFDERRVGAWLIDFAKTRRLPAGAAVTHRAPWRPGNHEEGFLTGLDALLRVVDEVQLPTADDERR